MVCVCGHDEQDHEQSFYAACLDEGCACEMFSADVDDEDEYA